MGYVYFHSHYLKGLSLAIAAYYPTLGKDYDSLISMERSVSQIDPYMVNK